MTDRLVAEFEAMTTVAADKRHARNSLIQIQHERRDAVLDPDALGKILPAHEIVETFRAVNRGTRAEIWGIAQRCEDLSDGVREIRNLFGVVDADIADRFAALLGAQR